MQIRSLPESCTTLHLSFDASFAGIPHEENRVPAIEILFLLLAGHALADFVLQSEAMSRGKNRHSSIHRKGDENFPAWYYWLSAHALVHGGTVYVITGSFILALVESACHWAIDFTKCERKITVHTDQWLHIAAKLFYVPVLLYWPDIA